MNATGPEHRELCLSEDELLAILDSDRPEEEFRAESGHLARCRTCRLGLGRFAAMIEVAHATGLFDDEIQTDDATVRLVGSEAGDELANQELRQAMQEQLLVLAQFHASQGPSAGPLRIRDVVDAMYAPYSQSDFPVRTLQRHFLLEAASVLRDSSRNAANSLSPDASAESTLAVTAEETVTVYSAAGNSDETVQFSARCKAREDAISRLENELTESAYAEAYLLKHFAGRSTEEIAELLEMAIDDVEQKLMTADGLVELSMG